MARTVQVTPHRWMARGEALVTEPGLRPLLVWGGIPGEPARVKIGHKGVNQVYGEWFSSERPDRHRVAPPCDRYHPCGGCPLMHVDAAGQADARAQLIRAALDDADLGDVEILPLVPCPTGLDNFRHVVKVGFGRSEIGRVKMGAWGRHSRDIVPIPQCNVAAPVLRKTMISLAHHTLTLGIEPYDTRSSRGVLRSAVLRASRTTGEVLVTLIAARRDRNLSDLAEELARGVSEVVGVWLHLNDGQGNAIFQRDDQGVFGVVPLVGKEAIEERMLDLVYRIGPGDFFQTNPATAEILYGRVLDRLDLVEGEAVIDLYSGVGGFALPAARRTGFSLGIEEVDGAVQRARESARINRVGAEFISGRVQELVPELVRRFKGTGAKIVVDPARRGLDEGVVEAMVALEPSRIAYVSCNPTAMGRDLAQLRALGFRIGPVEPFDMFPHTPHVECFTVLDRADATAITRRPPKRQMVR